MEHLKNATTYHCPCQRGDNPRSHRLKTQLSVWSTAEKPGPCPGQEARLVLHCSGCSCGTLREPAVLLPSGPCEPGESFPLGQSHISQSREFRYPAPDRRSAQRVMHVRAPARAERPLPSQTASAASTSLHLSGAGRSAEGDQWPGQHALTETGASSLTQHRANFLVKQRWWVAPAQLSTPLRPHPQQHERQLSQRKAPGLPHGLTASALNVVSSTGWMARLFWDFTVLQLFRQRNWPGSTGLVVSCKLSCSGT